MRKLVSEKFSEIMQENNKKIVDDKRLEYCNNCKSKRGEKMRGETKGKYSKSYSAGDDILSN